MKTWTLIGSSASLPGVEKIITGYYCGSKKTLKYIDADEMVVLGKDDKCLGRVVWRGRRFRFEIES